jgi:hypothetical protein
MPQENTTPAPTVQFEIERNGVNRAIVMDTKSRGDNKGKPYLRPIDVTPATFEQDIKWYGIDMVCAILNAKGSLMGSNITEQATDDDGVLKEDLARQYFADFSTRGETKADLEERKDNLVKELTAVSVDTSLSMEQRMEKIQVLGKEINSLTDAINAKSRERKSKTEPEAAVA